VSTLVESETERSIATEWKSRLSFTQNVSLNAAKTDFLV